VAIAFDAPCFEPPRLDPTRRVVLVVDDDEAILDVLAEVLSSEPDLFAIHADSGEAAVTLARSVQVDLLVLDLGMPGLDGFAVARQLRGDEATRSLPILAVSALPPAAVVPSAHAAGCDRFLAKPFDVDELLGAVRELLRERETAGA
jgi:CheY-like chemotaxis protein